MRWLAALVAVAATVAVPSGAASADPGRELAKVAWQVHTLEVRESQAVEDYHAARLQLAAATRQVQAARDRVRAAERELTRLQRGMDSMASTAYRTGADPMLAYVLGGAAETMLDRATALEQVTEHQSDQVDRVDLARRRLAAASQEAEQTLAKQQAIERRMAVTKQRVSHALAERKLVLSRLKAAEIRRLAAVRAAHEAAEARAARAAQAAAVDEAADDAAAARQRVAAPDEGTDDDEPGYAGSGGAGTAVSFARAQLGKPYRWGGSGPGSYDCSGLTMASWAAAGVSLPHSSRAQYGVGHRIPMSSVQPGDLLFYGSPIHHVAIYIGGGQQVAAPHSGDVVKIQAAFTSGYVGAVRP